MAIDPDALLIFRAREGTAPKENKKKLVQPFFSKRNDQKELGEYKPPRNSEPMVINPKKVGAKIDLISAHEEAKSKISELKKAVQKSESAEQPEEQAKKKGPWKDHIVSQEIPDNANAEAQAQSSEKPTRDINVLGFRIFGNKLQQESKPQLTSVYGTTTLSYKDVETSGSSINIFANREYISRRGTGRSKGQLSREAARGNRCAWHPWREAYAICAYCHRPFCFEDTIEFNKNYYCLEDIDSVSHVYKEKEGTSSNTMETLAGILLLFAFITFLYFANGQVFYIWKYVAHEGLPFFVEHLNYSYAFALIEMLLMTLSLVTAMMIFLQSSKRFLVGSAVCIFSVALFSYQYTSTGTFYLGLVDAFVFLAFFTLLYSRATIASSDVNEALTSPSAALEQNMLRWPNAGKF